MCSVLPPLFILERGEGVSFLGISKFQEGDGNGSTLWKHEDPGCSRERRIEVGPGGLQALRVAVRQ